jgi:uncharacterized protein (TIGR03086 family)
VTGPDDLIEQAELALAVCRGVLEKLDEADRQRATPCTEYTVADLCEHLDRSMVLLAGSAGAQLQADESLSPAARLSDLAGQAIAAWRRRGVDGTVALGRRDLPAADVVTILTMELVVHAWDLARALDRPLAVPDGVLAQLRERAPYLITSDRRGRAFAPEVPVSADATELDRLIAFTGRTP